LKAEQIKSWMTEEIARWRGAAQAALAGATAMAPLVGIVGAFAGDFFGVLGAGFARDAIPEPTEFTMQCWFLWGGLGGASLGAAPGLLWQSFQGQRWTYPFLGTAGCAAIGLLVDMAGWVEALLEKAGGPRAVDVEGPFGAGLVLLGFMGGGWLWLTKSPSSPVYVERSPRRIMSLISVGIVFIILGLVGFQTAILSAAMVVAPVIGTILGTGLASISWGLFYFLCLTILR